MHINKLTQRSIKKYEVFKTRHDTVYRITYTALAPEHDIVTYLIDYDLLSEDK
ncbi:MAG: hypothetical protein DRJ01_11540, partial [Bacteroidetes bacterium]